MGETLAQKIIRAHLLHGDMTPGSEIALRIDQTLTQDATGTMAYLEFETMGIPRVRTELSRRGCLCHIPRLPRQPQLNFTPYIFTKSQIANSMQYSTQRRSVLPLLRNFL